MRVVTLPGVFKPRSDSWMLADALRRIIPGPGADALDVCTGSGLLAVTAAQAGANATAIDVSRRAVATVKMNARLNGVGDRVEAIRGDLFAPLNADRRFDVIVSNPPYVPAEADELPARGAARAWDAGRDGRALLDRVCADARRRLKPGGALLLVHSSLCGTEQTLSRLRDSGLEPKVAERHRGPLGPLMLKRTEELEQSGVLEPGRRDEEVVVIEARRPA
jgi:release factor glutamine methyltransferase